MKVRISMLALAVVLYAGPGLAQHGHTQGTMGNGMGHGNMGGNSSSDSGSTHGVTIDQQLKNNTTIAGKIATLTKE